MYVRVVIKNIPATWKKENLNFMKKLKSYDIVSDLGR